MQFGKMNDPTAGDTVEVGHVDIHGVHMMRRKNLLWRGARRKQGEIWWASAFRGIFHRNVCIRPLVGRLGPGKTESPNAAQTGCTRIGLGTSARDADAHGALPCWVARVRICSATGS